MGSPRFGFWPRYLTAVTSKTPGAYRQAADWSRYTQPPARRPTGRSPQEIVAVATQKTGDTVLLWDGPQLAGFAVCHSGAGSEAGSGACLIKFGAARSGPKAAESFDRLLDACEGLAVSYRVDRLIGGANAGRPEAYQAMRRRGFRPDFLGVIMDRPNEPGYNREGSMS